MYTEINKLILEQKLSRKDLANKADIRYNTLLTKLNKKTKFTYDEAIKIKQALKTNIPIEKLFN